MLSTGSRRAWAKSGYDPERRCWSPLWLHLLDTAGVARLLARNWLTPTISNLIQAEFAESESGLNPEDEFALLASWIAGAHDIGKVTPAFSSQVPYLDDRMIILPLILRNAAESLTRLPASWFLNDGLRNWAGVSRRRGLWRR